MNERQIIVPPIIPSDFTYTKITEFLAERNVERNIVPFYNIGTERRSIVKSRTERCFSVERNAERTDKKIDYELERQIFGTTNTLPSIDHQNE